MIKDRVGMSRLDHQDKRVIKEILVHRGQKEIPVFKNKKVILVGNLVLTTGLKT